ncbi:MAG: GNAT family N-acetyltransferase [Oscillospiraceae bacterium]|nr:GNAT family N-acetyltransferase [Oscillospiraceae bacterium]
MTTVFLVRHGEAEGNLYRRIHGHYDSKITENGLLQLKALQQRFAPIHLDAAYSSDLYRARKTAEAVCAPKQLSVTLDPRLREVSMGDWEDLPWAEVARTDREQARNFSKRHLEWHVNGSEGFQKAADRFAQAIFEHAAAHDGQTIAIFAHGSVIRTFLCRANGLSLAEINQLPHSDNTGVSLMEIQGESIRLIYQNDNSHLPAKISTLAHQSWWKKQKTSFDPCLWFRPLDLDAESSLYLNARKEAWQSIYHTLDGFDGNSFWQEAKNAVGFDSRSLLIGMLEDSVAGILQLELRTDAKENAVWIPFYYMMPDFRGKHIGVQLLGQATSVCRAIGRSYLHLRVSSVNTCAQQFYQKYGFRVVGEEMGSFAPLHIMEKYIGYSEENC